MKPAGNRAAVVVAVIVVEAADSDANDDDDDDDENEDEETTPSPSYAALPRDEPAKPSSLKKRRGGAEARTGREKDENGTCEASTGR